MSPNSQKRLLRVYSEKCKVMPGYELIGEEEFNEIKSIFTESNGVLFGHGFDKLRNGRFRARELESEFQRTLGVKYALTCTSGTMAQFAAMSYYGVGPGDEVITQAHTFVATIETIIALGATPVLTESDASFNMCAEDLKTKISEKTKLIIPVHMLGFGANMNEIMATASMFDIPVLEDACEALGGKQKSKYLGTLGQIGIFSLDFAKTITTGEGGLIVTNDKEAFEWLRNFCDHGHTNNPKKPRGLDDRQGPGLNLRMSDLQAAVGLAQIKKLDQIVARNRHIYWDLRNGLAKAFEFRHNYDSEELFDTLIITKLKPGVKNKIIKTLTANGYSTKNIPDAMDWHFAGNMHNMFNENSRYYRSYSTDWKKTRIMLESSIALPISLKFDLTDIQAIIKIFNDEANSFNHS